MPPRKTRFENDLTLKEEGVKEQERQRERERERANEEKR
jgi:hypothetical protein